MQVTGCNWLQRGNLRLHYALQTAQGCSMMELVCAGIS